MNITLRLINIIHSFRVAAIRKQSGFQPSYNVEGSTGSRGPRDRSTVVGGEAGTIYEDRIWHGPHSTCLRICCEPAAGRRNLHPNSPTNDIGPFRSGSRIADACRACCSKSTVGVVYCSGVVGRNTSGLGLGPRQCLSFPNNHPCRENAPLTVAKWPL